MHTDTAETSSCCQTLFALPPRFLYVLRVGVTVRLRAHVQGHQGARENEINVGGSVLIRHFPHSPI